MGFFDKMASILRPRHGDETPPVDYETHGDEQLMTGDTLEIERVQHKVLFEIGKGGFGTVYLARPTDVLPHFDDEATYGYKTIKKLSAETRRAAGAFIDRSIEARRSLPQLPERVVPWYFDPELLERQGIVCASYVKGANLEKLLEIGARLPNGIHNLHYWMSMVVGSVRVLMEHGAVHGDIKEGNIIVNSGSGPGQNGSATFIDGDLFRTSVSFDIGNPESHGKVIGTPATLAPEVLRGSKYAPTTDIYAAGCIAAIRLCAALSVACNFVDAKPIDYLVSKRNGTFYTPDDAGRLNTAVRNTPDRVRKEAHALAAFIHRALEHYPENRPHGNEALELLDPARYPLTQI